MKGFRRLISTAFAMLLVLTTISFAEIENTIDLGIEAKSAILMEASTGEILYEMNSHEKLPPASITKVMTLLLIMEALDAGKISLDETVVCSEYAASMGGSQVYLEAGEQMSVHDLLKAIAVASGNDASVAMAEHISGSEQAFVNAMNERAQQLGMNNTHFVNSNGLDEDNHYTSAYDVALMSRELLKYPKIHDYLTIWIDSLRDGEFELVNTNNLIHYYKGANGIKTGSTNKALFCVSASAERDGMTLIAVIMGSPTSQKRFAGASKLLDHGFANYAVLEGVNKGEVIGTVDVLKGVKKNVEVVASEKTNVLVKKDKKGELRKEIDMADNVMAPVDKGQKVGVIKFYVGDENVNTVDLITTESIKKDSITGILSRLIKVWINAK